MHWRLGCVPDPAGASISGLSRDPPQVWAALGRLPCRALGWEERGIAQVCDHFHEHPLKFVASGNLSKISQSLHFYLTTEAWTGPNLLPSWPCTLSTTIIPLAFGAPKAQPPAAPSVPEVSRLPSGACSQCPGQATVFSPLFTSSGLDWGLNWVLSSCAMWAPLDGSGFSSLWSTLRLWWW